MGFPKVSFCTTVMNRLHHLQETLPMNLEDNKGFEACEFVILDYNSSDGLEDWIHSNANNFGNKVFYYRTTDAAHYQRSHSRNMAIRLAEGEIICNLDADNFTGPQFASYIFKVFKENENCFLSPSESSSADVTGKMCFTKNDFYNVRGYDEKIKSYGFEDFDLRRRFQNIGLKEVRYENLDFFHAISHSDQERIENEELFKTLKEIYVEKVDHQYARITLVLKNEMFKCITIIDTFFGIGVNNYVKPLTNLERYRIVERATVFGKTSDLVLKNSVKVTHRDTYVSIVHFVSQLDNKLMFLSNTKVGHEMINPNGFGEGPIVSTNKGLYA